MVGPLNSYLLFCFLLFYSQSASTVKKITLSQVKYRYGLQSVVCTFVHTVKERLAIVKYHYLWTHSCFVSCSFFSFSFLDLPLPRYRNHQLVRFRCEPQEVPSMIYEKKKYVISLQIWEKKRIDDDQKDKKGQKGAKKADKSEINGIKRSKNVGRCSYQRGLSSSFLWWIHW